MKKTIIKIILLLVLFIGIMYSISKSVWISDWNVATGILFPSGYVIGSTPELADYVKRDPGSVINLPYEALYAKTLRINGFNRATIEYSSGICMAHKKSNGNTTRTACDAISDIIDIEFYSNRGGYVAKNYFQNGEIELNGECKFLLHAIKLAYEKDSYIKTTWEKEIVNHYFYQLFDENSDKISSEFGTNNVNRTGLRTSYSEYATALNNANNAAYNDRAVSISKNNDFEPKVEQGTSNTEIILGPFKIQNANIINNIIYTDELSQIGSDNSRFSFKWSQDKINWIDFTYGSLPNNMNVYICIKDTTNQYDFFLQENMQVHFYASLNTVRARLILCYNPTYSGGEGAQQIGVYAVGRKEENQEIRYDLVNDIKTKLTVIKIGEEGEYLNKVGFMIFKEEDGKRRPLYNGNSNQRWQTGNMEFNEDWGWSFVEEGNLSGATMFHTDENGRFSISNLPQGQYAIGEIYNEGGDTWEKDGMSGSEYNVSYISNFTIQYKTWTREGYSNEIEKTQDNIDLYSYKIFKEKVETLGGIDLSQQGSQATVTIRDRIENKCKLSIKKMNENGIAQENVGFIIFKTDGHDDIVYGYLMYNGEDYDVVDNNGIIQEKGNVGRKALTGKQIYDETKISENLPKWGLWLGSTEEEQKAAREAATIFYTDENGEISISDLPAGKYYIAEVYNTNAGYENSTVNEYTIKEVDKAGQIVKSEQYWSDNVGVSDNISGFNEKMPYTQTLQANLTRTRESKITVVDKPGSNDTITLNIIKKNGGALADKVDFNIKKKGTNQYLAKEKTTGKIVGFVNGLVNDNTNTTTFTTNGGNLNISGLEAGNYEIIEIRNSDSNYSTTIDNATIISKPTDSKMSIEKKQSNICTINNIDINGTYRIEIVDKPGSRIPKQITIKGKVFVDSGSGKNNSNNGKYDNGEALVQQAQAILVRKSDNREITKSGKTGADGAYSITVNIAEDELKNYYIKFDCTNAYYIKEQNKTENVKTYSRTKTIYDNDEGNKCVEYKDGIGKTYSGTDADEKYGLSKSKIMNLGLAKNSTEEYLYQTINKVEISVNGKKYTYKYGESSKASENKNTPTVNWQGTERKDTFTRNIYPSDIAAFKDNTVGMTVRITYVITMQNLTNNDNHNFNWDSKYQEVEEQDKPEKRMISNIETSCTEDWMEVLSLTETFDSSLYTLSDSNWYMDGENTAKYNKTIDKMERSGSSEDTQVAYITFKVNDDKIKSILQDPKAIIEREQTEATMNCRHRWSNHMKWKYKDWVKYPATGSKEDGTYEPPYWDWEKNWNDAKADQNKGEEVTTESERRAKAPYCIFKLPEDGERTISGNVFEDTEENIRENELIGDGSIYDKYGNREESIKNVKVELWNKQTNSVATLYHRTNSGNYYSTEKAQRTTDENGDYSFNGVVAGDYWIVYRYGDGSQIVKDANASGTRVYSSQYKSTIIKNKKFNYNENTSGGKWYIDEYDQSMAVDIITDREFNENQYEYSSLYKGVKNDLSNKLVEARTPNFEVGIEFTDSEDVSCVNNRLYDKEFGTVQSYRYMNFGIIKMPVVSVNIYNTISYVTMTLSNGQVITQGDPSGTANIQYVSTLDENDTPYGYGRGGYVKVEIDTNYLYGSTLEVTYDIRVLNNSDLNYKTKEYYYYGTHGNIDDEYTVSIDRILYYIDPAMTYMHSTKNDIEIDGYNESKDKKLDSMSPSNNASKINAEREITKEPKEMLDINLNSNKELHTYYSEDENTAKTKSSIKVLSVTTSKLLSTEDDDLEFKNYAEIVKITTDKDGNGNICRFMAPTASFENEAKDVLNSSGDKLADITRNSRNLYRTDYRSITTDVATITVTPPTGLKENIIIFISIGIGLIVFVGGVIIIKKKVL